MILFFDSETTGFHHWELPHDHPIQPDLVQLGCVLVDDDGKERATLELMVRPNGFEIPKSASDVHGISTADATRMGVGLPVAVAMFANLCRLADTVAAHFLAFDERIMATAFSRAEKPGPVLPLKRVCTIDMARPILKIPPTARMKATGYGHLFKNPSLADCYDLMFGEKVPGHHGALADARACARVHAHLASGKGRMNPVGRFFKKLRHR